jgi:hypothetical protein
VNVCTWRSCGMCGRCTGGAGSDGTRPFDRRDYEFCDNQDCGEIIGPLTGRISLSGVGVFCSVKCADIGAARHAERMQPRRKVSA